MHFIPIPIPFPSHGWFYSHSHGNPMRPMGSQSFPFPCTSLVTISCFRLIEEYRSANDDGQIAWTADCSPVSILHAQLAWMWLWSSDRRRHWTDSLSAFLIHDPFGAKHGSLSRCSISAREKKTYSETSRTCVVMSSSHRRHSLLHFHLSHMAVHHHLLHHLHDHHLHLLLLVQSFTLNLRLDSSENHFIRRPFTFLPDWFHGLLDHLMFLFCSTAGLLCMVC